MARLPKDFLATGFRGNREKKSVAPHYLSEPFASALAPLCGPSDFFCHIIWRQREGSTKRAKRGKKATPRYVAEPFASLRCIDKGFRGICATLSGGNPPRYETNHMGAHRIPAPMFSSCGMSIRERQEERTECLPSGQI